MTSLLRWGTQAASPRFDAWLVTEQGQQAVVNSQVAARSEAPCPHPWGDRTFKRAYKGWKKPEAKGQHR